MVYIPVCARWAGYRAIGGLWAEVGRWTRTDGVVGHACLSAIVTRHARLAVCQVLATALVIVCVLGACRDVTIEWTVVSYNIQGHRASSKVKVIQVNKQLVIKVKVIQKSKPRSRLYGLTVNKVKVIQVKNQGHID